MAVENMHYINLSTTSFFDSRSFCGKCTFFVCNIYAPNICDPGGSNKYGQVVNVADIFSFTPAIECTGGNTSL